MQAIASIPHSSRAWRSIPTEYLEQVAREFETWHWRFRMGFNAASAVSAFIGFIRLYHHRLVSRGALDEKA